MHAIKAMLAAGHRVRVVYVAERFGVDFSKSDVAALCSDVRKVQFAGVLPTLLCWLGGMSVSLAWCGSAAAKSVIREVAAGSDVVWVEHLRGAGMLPDGISVPIVWDAVDALGPLFEGRASLVDNPLKALIFRLEAKRTRREEGIRASRFKIAIAVTEREAALIGPGVIAIPNGVDCDYFQPSRTEPDPSKPLHICMFGRWNYLPNAHGCAQFLRDVWPAVSHTFPGAICTVIGPGAAAGSVVADAALQGQAAGTVVLEGTVADIRPYIHKSVLTICPAMLAAGMQNKILESIACGVPVVCSAIAAEGTLPGGLPGVFPASTASEMVEVVTQLLADPVSAAVHGRQGRNIVEKTMTWQPSYAQIASVLERVLHP